VITRKSFLGGGLDEVDPLPIHRATADGPRGDWTSSPMAGAGLEA
jgi:hypothetical protein